MAMLQVRVDDNLKEQASILYENLGMDLSTAVRMFLKKSIQVGGIPFDVKYDDGTVNFLMALRSMQERSKELGNDKMTLDDINEEIRHAREEKKMNKWFIML